jgi:hypothetical protein
MRIPDAKPADGKPTVGDDTGSAGGDGIPTAATGSATEGSTGGGKPTAASIQQIADAESERQDDIKQQRLEHAKAGKDKSYDQHAEHTDCLSEAKGRRGRTLQWLIDSFPSWHAYDPAAPKDIHWRKSKMCLLRATTRAYGEVWEEILKAEVHNGAETEPGSFNRIEGLILSGNEEPSPQVMRKGLSTIGGPLGRAFGHELPWEHLDTVQGGDMLAQPFSYTKDGDNALEFLVLYLCDSTASFFEINSSSQYGRLRFDEYRDFASNHTVKGSKTSHPTNHKNTRRTRSSTS